MGAVIRPYFFLIFFQKSVDIYKNFCYNSITVKERKVIRMTKEQQIKNYMTKLGISYEEATQLWEDDQEDYIGEEGEAMTAKAKEIKRYEQKPTERKKVNRERKVDEEKKHLLQMFKVLLEGNKADIIAIKTETEINFVYNDENYTLKLTKHRKKK